MLHSPSRDELVSQYKTILRNIIERNPSGLRLKIAAELGTHKSFVSQITNPSDPTPIPARHVPQLFMLCHFTELEKRNFTASFKKAHPNRVEKISDQERVKRRTRLIKVEVPILNNAKRQRDFEAYVKEIIKRLGELM